MSNEYKKTLNLPSTKFSMRAGLANREPEAVTQWIEDDVYGQMIARRREQDAPLYIMHDGPPYANGNIHHGHVLNKVLKDFVVKYRNMAGFLCEFVPGWDCHGLPIEHNVEKKLGKKKRDMTKVQLRQACRAYALEQMQTQRDDFKRMLVFADWENPYLTMDYSYEAATVRELGAMFGRGLVYRGLKPVHWDWASQTALAEAEVDYKAFTTNHVYVKFPFAELPEELAASVGGDDQVFMVIWTTTPWTLPANLAIALNPDLTYQLVRVGGEVYVLADGLRDAVIKDCRIDPESVEVLASFEGRALVGELGEGKGFKARHPFIERDSVLLPADYVTLEQGTGCVHTAPGHGQEDFQLGQEHGLDVINPVNSYGKFRERDVPEWGNMQVFQANPLIAQKLADLGLLLNDPSDTITIDRYPHGWRSKKPVIFRATSQWFVAMEPESAGLTEGYNLRQRALETIEEVEWLPKWGKDRITGMVENRPDWCISRQRAWGVPITAMHCEDCGEVLVSQDVANHVAALVEDRGVDVWFELEPHELMPEGTVCPGCGGTHFRKDEDILDVWVDSGTSWSAVLDTKLGVGPQADLYLEGSDQHRGWFQSSMMCGLLSRDISPYKTCLTHGFVLDEKGHKYSKSSANYEPPAKMLQQYGAEIMRLWVSAVDYRGDITLSGDIMKRMADSYRKIRNTFRFLLGGLDNFDPATDAVALDQLLPLDQWIVQRTGEVVARIERAFEEFQFHLIYHALVQFTTVDLSNFYLDVSKDRMYCEDPTGEFRRSGQTAYWLVLDALLRAAAPILSFTTQEAWAFMPRRAEDPEYVFHADFPAEAKAWSELLDPTPWTTLLEVRAEVQRALEAKRGSKKDRKPGQIGSSQEAHVTLTASGDTFTTLEGFGEQELATLFVVSEVVLGEGEVPEDAAAVAEVVPSEKKKCPRCWNHWVPADSDNVLCTRCESVLVTDNDVDAEVEAE